MQNSLGLWNHQSVQNSYLINYLEKINIFFIISFNLEVCNRGLVYIYEDNHGMITDGFGQPYLFQTSFFHISHYLRQ